MIERCKHGTIITDYCHGCDIEYRFRADHTIKNDEALRAAAAKPSKEFTAAMDVVEAELSHAEKGAGLLQDALLQLEAMLEATRARAFHTAVTERNLATMVERIRAHLGPVDDQFIASVWKCLGEKDEAK